MWELSRIFTTYVATDIALAEASGAYLFTCDEELRQGDRTWVLVFAKSLDGSPLPQEIGGISSRLVTESGGISKWGAFDNFSGTLVVTGEFDAWREARAALEEKFDHRETEVIELSGGVIDG